MPARVQNDHKSNVSIEMHQEALIKLPNITMRAHGSYSSGHKSTTNIIPSVCRNWGKGSWVKRRGKRLGMQSQEVGRCGTGPVRSTHTQLFLASLTVILLDEDCLHCYP